MPSDGEVIKGTVQKTSPYGIMINGEWCNPHGKAKEFMSGATTGAEVEITMTGHKNDFRFIKILRPAEDQQTGSTTSGVPTGDNQTNPPARNSVEYWERKELRDLKNDERISRHGAMNTAKDILGPIKPDAKNKDFGEYMIKASKIAQMVLSYVNNEEYEKDYIEMASKIEE